MVGRWREREREKKKTIIQDSHSSLSIPDQNWVAWPHQLLGRLGKAVLARRPGGEASVFCEHTAVSALGAYQCQLALV